MRDTMLALRTARGGKLHWRDSDDAHRAAIIETVSLGRWYILSLRDTTR